MTRQRRRSGLTMLVVVVVIMVATSLLAAATSQLVDHHRQCRLRHAARQCRLLATAGLERADSRIAADAEYQGETWTVPADQLNFPHDAEVVIRIEQDGEQTTLVATAQYPAGEHPRVKQTRRMALDTPSSPSN